MEGRRRNHRGFTLIELLVVVAVIGIVASIAISNLAGYRVRAYNSNAMADLRVLKLGLETYYAEHRQYP